jgi:hypothetical protein
MLKKLFYILPLYLAFTIVMAHSIVPHHHVHEVEATTHHHHDGAGHHDHDEDKNQNKSEDADTDLSHGFEFFHHAGSTIQFISSHLSVINILSSLDTVFIVSNLFDIRPCESPHTPISFSTQKILFSFLYSPQTGLRAPPSIG